MENNKKEQLKLLASAIKCHLKEYSTYAFRPIKIDGINCYVIIFSKYNLINIESIYIRCKVTLDDIEKIQKYSLYHTKYNTIEDAIKRIEDIVKTYKIYNGELVSRKVFENSKLEEAIMPYNEEEKCCVCMENTYDITECNHPICLHCREKCVMSLKTNCPICRKENILPIYNNINGLINNDSSSILKKAIDDDSPYYTYSVSQNHEEPRDELNEGMILELSQNRSFQDLIIEYQNINRNHPQDEEIEYDLDEEVELF
jgi:hypothetical protein